MKLGEEYSVTSDYDLSDVLTDGYTSEKIDDDFNLDNLAFGDLTAGEFIAAAISFFAIFFLVILGGLIIAYVYYGIVTMKIFKKANHVNPWAGWVPYYKHYVLSEVSGYPGYLGLIAAFAPMVPVVGALASLVILIIILHKLSLSFGKDAGFTIGLVLLNPIFMGILAFSSMEYVGPGGDSNLVPEWSNASKK